MALPRTKINLSVIPAFSRLQPVVIRELELCAAVYTLEAGQFLYQQGDLARAFFIVCTGGLRLVEHTADGQDVQLKIFGQGSYLPCWLSLVNIRTRQGCRPWIKAW
ncbi:MAG: cyclic nucleotide-binding domain-containing protein [Anaerolineae bacterium]|nr:cyclic nucleotide-binding domain-containing protein [Anaerolineae bacterium]